MSCSLSESWLYIILNCLYPVRSSKTWMGTVSLCMAPWGKLAFEPGARPWRDQIPGNTCCHCFRGRGAIMAQFDINISGYPGPIQQLASPTWVSQCGPQDPLRVTFPLSDVVAGRAQRLEVREELGALKLDSLRATKTGTG